MLTTLRGTAAALAGLVLGFAAASGSAAIIGTDASTTVNVPGLTGFQTTGSDMVGMTVTLNFVGGTSETVAWQATGAGTGAAIGTNWTVSVSGDTFASDAWTADFGNLSVLSMVLDGAPGLTVFDLSFGGLEGTPNSANGRDFVTNLIDDALIAATYSNVVAITPNPPVGDLWHVLTVDFSGVTGGSVSGRFLFSQDADNDSRLAQVPEPAALGVFGLALLGLGFMRRRRAA